MGNDLYFEGKRFISSGRAAKITAYSNDYIGQLCRGGKLDCRMVGRSWYVSHDSIIAHQNSTGNGLQGKSERYRRKVSRIQPEVIPAPASNYVSIVESPRDATHFIFNTIGQEEHAEISEDVFKPISLDVGETKIDSAFVSSVQPQIISDDIRERRKDHVVYVAKNFPRLVSGVVALFVAVSAFYFALDVNPDSRLAYESLWNKFEISSENIFVNRGIKYEASVFSGVKTILDKSGLAVYKTLNDAFLDTRKRILVMTGMQIEVVEISKSDVYARPTEGLVVLPTEDDMDREAAIAKIRDSFSDEVSIEPADRTSGVITPVWRKSQGDDYLYVLVPIKN
jgi:hypothetical protein